MRTEIATVTERERDIVFNATHIKLYIRAEEKKSKADQKKKTKQTDAAKKKFETRSFIYYDEGPPRKRDEHQ